eukprot:g6345.t1
MGGLSSKEVLEEAERQLFYAGRKWWHSLSGENIESFETRDVPITNDMKSWTWVESEKDENEKESKESSAHMETIHTVRVKKSTNGDPPIVFLHGYAQGSGLFYSLLPVVARRYPGEIYAVDALGSGLSSRPDDEENEAASSSASVESVEEFLVDGLERWRKSMAIDKFVLAGHSIGGYTSVVYAERHPNRVAKLILISPVGLPETPENYEEKRKNSRFLFRTLGNLWASGVSPYTIVRHFPFGRTMLDKIYVNRRFRDDDWIVKKQISDYIEACWNHGNISVGGYAHATLLKPGAWAKRPIGNRIVKLQVPHVSFIYGAHDWMDSRHAQRVIDVAKEKKSKTEYELLIIQGAGHNVHIDQPCAAAMAILSAVSSNPTNLSRKRKYNHDESVKFLVEEKLDESPPVLSPSSTSKE